MRQTFLTQSFSTQQLEKFQGRISSNSIVLINCLVIFVHILHISQTNFTEELESTCQNTLLEQLVYCKYVILVKMLSSDVLSVVQL